MARVLACSVLLLFTAVFAANDAGNKPITVDGLSKTAQETLSKYQSSIKYWDTPNVDDRRDILKQLVEEWDEVRIPGCPRIRYPIICDSDGEMSENVCYFRKRRIEKQGLLPVLVFTSTPIEQARAKCDKETRKSP